MLRHTRRLILVSLIVILPACKGDNATQWDFGPPDAAVGEGLRFNDLLAFENMVTGDMGSDIYVDPNDWDGDGLTNDEEKKLGTNPHSKDSDNDGVDDKTEVGGDPSKPKDSDNDGKPDAIEPSNFDSDKDGTNDSLDTNDNDGPCSEAGSSGPPRLFFNATRGKVSGKVQDLHLTKACSPYKVLGDYLWFIEGAKLTSEAGVEVRFGAAAALKFGNHNTTAIMDVKGTAAAPVIMRADSLNPTKGYWRGIVMTNGGTLRMEHVSVTWAGGPTLSADAAASLLIKVATSISLTSCTFSNGAGYGIHAAFSLPTATLFTSFSKNAFTALKYSAALNINHLGEIASDNQFGSVNAGGVVHVSDGTVSRKANWKNLNVPYVFDEASINVNAKLTIAKGATLYFKPDTLVLVGYSGTGSLHIMGESGSPVIFKTQKGGPGSWQGLMLAGGSNTLNYLQLTGGGKSNFQSIESALYVDKTANLATSNTSISNSSGYGVYYFRANNGCTTAKPDDYTYGAGITSCKFFCLDEKNGAGTCLKK